MKGFRCNQLVETPVQPLYYCTSQESYRNLRVVIQRIKSIVIAAGHHVHDLQAQGAKRVQRKPVSRSHNHQALHDK